MVDGIGTTTNNNVEYATQSNSEMDKDAFLKLMIAQLQNQDPLEPLDGTDYSAQLAQFSSLEQLQNINDNLNMSLDANYLLSQSVNNTMTASLIGQDVKIAGDTVTYEGQDTTSIGYDLIAPAHEIEINIYDSNGSLVKTFDDLETKEGQYKLSWDFTDNNGNGVAVGDYRVEVEATTLSLDEMEVAQYFIGTIGAVRFSAEGTTIVVNGLEYDISEVFEVIGAVENSQDEESASEENNNPKSGDDETSG
jgi:flagellar basal-body rod modification protein FlgD